MQVAGAANFAASAPAYGCGAAAAPPPRAPPLFVPDESQPHLSPPAPPPLTSSQPPPPAGGGGGVHAMYGPPPGSIGLAAGLSGASGLGSLYPADAGGAGGAAANMAGAGAAPPPAPASGGPVVGVDAAVERGGSAHGGLAKTWVAQASEQQVTHDVRSDRSGSYALAAAAAMRMRARRLLLLRACTRNLVATHSAWLLLTRAHHRACACACVIMHGAWLLLTLAHSPCAPAAVAASDRPPRARASSRRGRGATRTAASRPGRRRR